MATPRAITVIPFSSSAEFPLVLLSAPILAIPQPEDLNFVFTVARVVCDALHLFGNNPPIQSELGFVKQKGYREFLKHVSVHLFTTSEEEAFVPFPSLHTYEGELKVSPELQVILLTKLTQVRKADFAAAGLSDNYLTDYPYELYPEAEYAIFHMQNYEPWRGFGEAIFLGCFSTMGQNWAHYLISDGQLPSDEALRTKKGILITGARYACYDQSQVWMQDFYALISKIYTQYPAIRLVGICFGCQFLAKALGGDTIKSPKFRFFYGVETIHTTEGFAREFPAFPLTSFDMAECHGDCVLRIPPEAEIYGYSETADIEVWGVPNRILCFQGHPDFSRYFVQYFHLPYANNRPGLISRSFGEVFEEYRNSQLHDAELRALIKEFLSKSA